MILVVSEHIWCHTPYQCAVEIQSWDGPSRCSEQVCQSTEMNPTDIRHQMQWQQQHQAPYIKGARPRCASLQGGETHTTQHHIWSAKQRRRHSPEYPVPSTEATLKRGQQAAQRPRGRSSRTCHSETVSPFNQCAAAPPMLASHPGSRRTALVDLQGLHSACIARLVFTSLILLCAPRRICLCSPPRRMVFVAGLTLCVLTPFTPLQAQKQMRCQSHSSRGEHAAAA